MVFHMGRIVQVARSDQEIANLAARQPAVIAIEPNSGTNKARKAIIEEARFRDDETIYRVGHIDRTALPAPTTAPAGPARDVEGEYAVHQRRQITPKAYARSPMYRLPPVRFNSRRADLAKRGRGGDTSPRAAPPDELPGGKGP